jgi:Tfp pilus assembly protein PilF
MIRCGSISCPRRSVPRSISGQFAEAEEKYREALRAAPTDQTALVGLARLYDRQGQGPKAIETYQKAAQAHATSGLVFNDLGLCYRRQRQLDPALAAFRKAVDLQPDNAKYRNNLAGALVEGGRSEEALQELAAVNSPAVAHYNLAHLLEQRSQRPEAIQHLQQALALDPNLVPARDMLNQMARVSTAAAATEVVARRAAIAASEQLDPPTQNTPADFSAYTANATGEPPSATALEPPSYHVGDDNTAAVSTPAASTTLRPASAAWETPASRNVKTTWPLPPID